MEYEKTFLAAAVRKNGELSTIQAGYSLFYPQWCKKVGEMARRGRKCKKARIMRACYSRSRSSRHIRASRKQILGIAPGRMMDCSHHGVLWSRYTRRSVQYTSASTGTPSSAVKVKKAG